MDERMVQRIEEAQRRRMRTPDEIETGIKDELRTLIELSQDVTVARARQAAEIEFKHQITRFRRAQAISTIVAAVAALILVWRQDRRS